MAIPFFGRLHFEDYQSLIITCLLLLVEKVFRVVAFFIPAPLLRYFLALLPRYWTDDMNSHRTIHTVASFCERLGYPIEEHLVTTKDGFVLGIHRIPYSKETRPGAETGRPVVLLWHGFMMSSEVFVCSHVEERNLAFVLSVAGYDVWMGNMRGNKYSYKHLTHKPTSEAFWDFSIDELARFDIPDTVDYILRTTGARQLGYVGFSQGTAQMFAALSISPELNEKISTYVALAPATKPPMLESASVSAILRSSPQAIFLILGRRCAMAYSLFWRDYLPRPVFVRLIHLCVYLLFGWDLQNIGQLQQEACIGHLYSYTSTKLVVHWFQIMAAQRFQVYDDSPPRRSVVGFFCDPSAEESGSFGHVVPAFPTRRIETPMAIFYGGRDNLSNIDNLLKDLPKPVVCERIDHYEHLDFLWADDASTILFPMVLDVLDATLPDGVARHMIKAPKTF